ncbi:MAG: hypothetical protein IPH41_10950 [Sulfuritalea sp.]|nr:hypothetical protein [Sulfuritalea sp.]
MAKDESWKPAALGKFLALAATARGLSSGAVSYSERLTQLLADRREHERMISEPHRFGAAHDGDNQRVLARIAAHEVEITRIAAQIEPILVARAVASAKHQSAAVLATSCGEALVKLGLFSREEVYL